MRRKLNFLGLLLVSGVIVYGSFSPAPKGNPSTGFIPVHFAAYSVLAAAFLLNLHDRDSAYIEAFLAASLFGLGIEIIQATIPYRFFGWNDILLNLLGAGVVLVDKPINLTDNFISFQDYVIERAASKTSL